MALGSVFCKALAILYLGWTVQGQVDLTLQPGTSGRDVVETLEDLILISCTFPDDKLFYRRVAYVETQDGVHPKTYRIGYHGGIYQVDEDMFKITQSLGAFPFLEKYFKQIEESFDIVWLDVQWQDLRMPLYSGLAARLYTHYQSREEDEIPRDVEHQGDFWEKYYREDGDDDDFEDIVNGMYRGCDPKLDLVFVLDANDDISSHNFEKITDFTQDVVKFLDIGRNRNRVGVITYSKSEEEEFHLDRYFNKEEMLDVIHHIDDHDSHRANTHLGLNTMSQKYFTTAYGARSEEAVVPKVSIIVMAKKSRDNKQTIIEAAQAHDKDISMFTIGIGDKVDQGELEVIASIPTCYHLITLEDFDELEELWYTIEDRLCHAPIIISPGNNGTNIGGSIPAGEDQDCQVKVPQGGATVKIEAGSGSVIFYLSGTTYPSAVYYQYKLQSTPGQPAEIFLEQPPTGDQEGLWFCNIKGDEEEDSDIGIGISPGPAQCDSNPCQHGGTCTANGDRYTCECPPEFTGTNCENPVNTWPCPPHADCKCLCHPGWTGQHCDTIISEEYSPCEPNPCKYGTCQVNAEGCEAGITFTCQCEQGYSGQICDEPDDCGPCVCKCNDGWAGLTCGEIDKRVIFAHSGCDSLLSTYTLLTLGCYVLSAIDHWTM